MLIQNRPVRFDSIFAIEEKAQNLISSPHWKYNHLAEERTFYDYSFLNYPGYLNPEKKIMVENLRSRHFLT